MSRTLLLLAFCLAALPVFAQQQAPILSGELGIHDPSIVVVDGVATSFATGVERAPDGGAIRLKTSPDGLQWTEASTLGAGMPAWVKAELGFTPLNIWAPSVSRHGDRLYLYYSVSTFGKNSSAIGLMTNAAFDPATPAAGWLDQGMVLRSDTPDDFNAIDPWRIDLADGRAFLAFGSFWDGIKMRALDPDTGLLLAPDTPVIDLASRGGGAIEAPAILEHDGQFFLFVAFDSCCRGLQSTYNIRVGRADAVEGPYVDADGTSLLEGGGTVLLRSNGRYRGPGGQEVFERDGNPFLVFHFYDRDAGGAPKLAITPIGWSADGWPVLGELP